MEEPSATEAANRRSSSAGANLIAEGEVLLKSIGRTPSCFSTAIKPSRTVGLCLAAVC